ncbi:hybrid sensor histidine kinase/response regulator [Sulfurimonas sp.]|nr:hybrid sensor histidine kinase/response regulator [Sulfurimonas sp.]
MKKIDYSEVLISISDEKSILLIQNEEDNELSNLLKKYFKEVEVVTKGEDALSIHMPERYDIVYIDMDISDMKPKEIIANIKNYDYTQKFIMITSMDGCPQIESLMKMNVVNYMLKPLYLENFLLVTVSVLDVINQNKLRLNENKSGVVEKKTQQQKLTQAGEMIGMIAHQWRQPLSIITTLVGTIKTRIELGFYDKKVDPYATLKTELSECFTTIEESSVFLSQTVDDFRNFYKPNNSKLIFNLSEVIKKVCRMSLLNTGLGTINTIFDLDESIEIETYENELIQVLINLFNNSKDALKENNILKPTINIILKESESKIYINVIDNAGGINEDNINQIFLPYFSTKEEKNGTGLGLNMSKIIVEEHIGGSLSAKNSPLYKGADFCIALNKKSVEVKGKK